jgi:hypothetical protein
MGRRERWCGDLPSRPAPKRSPLPGCLPADQRPSLIDPTPASRNRVVPAGERDASGRWCSRWLWTLWQAKAQAPTGCFSNQLKGMDGSAQRWPSPGRKDQCHFRPTLDAAQVNGTVSCSSLSIKNQALPQNSMNSEIAHFR